MAYRDRQGGCAGQPAYVHRRRLQPGARTEVAAIRQGAVPEVPLGGCTARWLRGTTDLSDHSEVFHRPRGVDARWTRGVGHRGAGRTATQEIPGWLNAR